MSFCDVRRPSHKRWRSQWALLACGTSCTPNKRLKDTVPYTIIHTYYIRVAYIVQHICMRANSISMRVTVVWSHLVCDQVIPWITPPLDQTSHQTMDGKLLMSFDSKSQYVTPLSPHNLEQDWDYLDNKFGTFQKLIGFGLGAAPWAQIRRVFEKYQPSYRDTQRCENDTFPKRGYTYIGILSHQSLSNTATLLMHRAAARGHM